MPLLLLVVIIAIAAYLVVLYNGLVRKRTTTQEAWSQIDVELKRRHDLVPNLVETVKGYMGHERQTLEAVVAARQGAVDASNSGDRSQIAPAENMLSQSLKSLFALSENYPDLKAIQGFTALQEQLTATEDKIEFARRYYNGAVREYNTAIQVFPGSIVAGIGGFQASAFFGADAADREPVSVNFSQPPAAGPPPTSP